MMGIQTSAYKRTIDDRDGWTNEVTVELEHVRTDAELIVMVGNPGNDKRAHMDLAHALELREALDEAIMLLQKQAADDAELAALLERVMR
jgi:hypothetical protein